MGVVRALLVHFDEVLRDDTYKKKSIALVLEVRYFLEKVTNVIISAANSIYDILRQKSIPSLQALVELDVFRKFQLGLQRDLLSPSAIDSAEVIFLRIILELRPATAAILLPNIFAKDTADSRLSFVTSISRR